MTAGYLADKSALARAHLAPVARRLEPLFVDGEVATCGIVGLELLFSARSSADYLAILTDQRGLPRAEVSEVGIDRAIEVQAALARKSQHRAVPIPDLLIAATAETAGLTAPSPVRNTNTVSSGRAGLDCVTTLKFA